MDKKRLYIGIGLGVVIIVLSTIMFIGGHDFFKSRLELKYADGCIEKYENGNIVTPLCTEGRRIEQERQNGMMSNGPLPPILNKGTP